MNFGNALASVAGSTVPDKIDVSNIEIDVSSVEGRFYDPNWMDDLKFTYQKHELEKDIDYTFEVLPELPNDDGTITLYAEITGKNTFEVSKTSNLRA